MAQIFSSSFEGPESTRIDCKLTPRTSRSRNLHKQTIKRTSRLVRRTILYICMLSATISLIKCQTNNQQKPDKQDSTRQHETSLASDEEDERDKSQLEMHPATTTAVSSTIEEPIGSTTSTTLDCRRPNPKAASARNEQAAKFKSSKEFTQTSHMQANGFKLHQIETGNRRERQFGRLVSEFDNQNSNSARSQNQNIGEPEIAQQFNTNANNNNQQMLEPKPAQANVSGTINDKQASLLELRAQTALEPNATTITTSPASVPTSANNEQQASTTLGADLVAMQMQSLANELATQSQSADFGLMSKQHGSATLTNRMGDQQQNSNNNQDKSNLNHQDLLHHGELASTYQPISDSPSSISVITPILNRPNGASQAQQANSNSLSTMVKPLYVLGTPLGERDYNHESSAANNAMIQMMQQSQRNRAPKISEQTSAELHANGSVLQEPQQQTAGTKLEQQQFASAKKPPHTAPISAKNLVDSQIMQQVDQISSMLDQSSSTQSNGTTASPMGFAGDRMSGPSLIYTDGQLTHSDSLPVTTPPPLPLSLTQAPTSQQQATSNNSVNQQALAPRLFQSQATYNTNQLAGSPSTSSSTSSGGAAVVGNNPRRPSLPPPVNQANAASGFRSPMSPSGPLLGSGSTAAVNQQQQTTALIQPPLNSAPLNQQQQIPTTLSQQQNPFIYQTSLPPYLGLSSQQQQQMYMNQGANQLSYGAGAPRHPYGNQQAQQIQMQLQQQQQSISQAVVPGSQLNAAGPSQPPAISGSYSGRRPLNITRVEHISAECSNDLIRAVVVFNGTFKGIIYSSNYANDPTCLYINGTGSSRYEFSIRLNQCGTMNKMEVHQPSTPGEARRRDQVMWNSLSIQYNPIIEQEWDEHFKVSCEYGSDFWKTVSFSPFNVVTNTGSPVVFTINPPQCQMDVLLGHGIGPKIAVDGPVTVGDPLTLLIHMKSEKAGYDILVKNCVAHNGGKQRMQLIDSNGCVVNERFISPFRGTYNDNDMRHVTLYAYLKAFRFTGSPVLYLECEIHMCQSACPPQMCYWRRLSKRSTDDFEYEYMTNRTSSQGGDENEDDDDAMSRSAVISDSVNLFKALQVRQGPEPSSARQRALRSNNYQQQQDIFSQDDQAQLVCYRYAEVFIFMLTVGALWLLICTIAIACCLRVRKVTRLAQQQRYRHHQSPPSPGASSLLSASSSVASMLSATIPYAPAPKSRLNLLAPITPTHAHPTSSFLWDANCAAGKPKVATPNRSLYAQQNRKQPYC